MTVNDYFENATESRHNVKNLFGGRDPLETLILKDLKKYADSLEIGCQTLRFKGKKGSFGVVRYWCGNTEGLASKAHVDNLQYYGREDLKQFNFTSMPAVVSIIICLSNDAQFGGETTIFNRQPTMNDLCYSEDGNGYGFSQSYLADAEKIEFTLESGDIGCINTGFVHSVGATRAGGKRITEQMFGGCLPTKKTFRYWS